SASFSCIPPLPPAPPLFPYTTLFRSIAASAAVSITLDDTFEQQVSRIEAACGRVDSGGGILILADVHGSSPFRASLAMLERRRRSEEHTSELQSRENLVCRLLLEKKK